MYRDTTESVTLTLEEVNFHEVAAHCFFHNENMKDLDKIDLDLERARRVPTLPKLWS